MGKIVIPKHSADVEEMNAVLKIHYEANDWVKSREYVEKLKTMIDPDLYPSSYPKKAQVPTYFGFLECKITSGNNITERRITNSGKKMYEAIISDDIATRQELLMDAVENVIFGKNNGGSPSSESDIDAPDLAIRCILDTGYCTSHEYAYMIWNLHDNGKKYYRSLPEILKDRSFSRLLAYHSYFINKIDKIGTKYQLSLQMEDAVNKKQESVLLTELREEAKKQSESEQQGLLLDILKYSKSMQNMKNVSDKNLDIEPVNLVFRALSELEYLYENELKYLLAETILGDLNYSDALIKIKEGRTKEICILSNREGELDYKVINSLVNGRLLVWSELNGKKILKIDSNLNNRYLEQFKRLMIYAVDIHKNDKEAEDESLPLSIKSVIINDDIMDKEIEEWNIDTSYNYQIVQGDYIIFVKPEFKGIANYIVYQVVSVNKSGSNMKIGIVKHNYINKEKESEILKDLKEAYYGECE